MRSVYGAGIYDYLMDNDIYPFDLGIGVSAGAADLATYFARQRGRVLRYYTIYPKRKEYMGLWPLLRYGTFMNLKYIYEDLSLPGKEDPFDADAYTSSHTDMVFIATDAETGKPAYFPKDALRKGEMTVLEASAALPVEGRSVKFSTHFLRLWLIIYAAKQFCNSFYSGKCLSFFRFSHPVPAFWRNRCGILRSG